MRGLTPLERNILERRALNAPRVAVPFGSSSEAAVRALQCSGRLVYSGKVTEGAAYSLTDLGRLALRVCPVGEP